MRIEIDSIDEKLVDLLNQRARRGLEIGRYRHKNHRAVFEPKREEEVMANVTRSNHGPLLDEDLATIYAAILAAMRRLQSPEYLGRS